MCVRSRHSQFTPRQPPNIPILTGMFILMRWCTAEPQKPLVTGPAYYHPWLYMPSWSLFRACTFTYWPLDVPHYEPLLVLLVHDTHAHLRHLPSWSSSPNDLLDGSLHGVILVIHGRGRHQPGYHGIYPESNRAKPLLRYFPLPRKNHTLPHRKI